MMLKINYFKNQQDSVVNKATSVSSGQYVEPTLKSSTKKDAAQDQYDCDSTCLSMGGNKTYTRTYVENKTERCPTGFKSPDQKSYIITATRQVSKQYNGNELISTYATNWAPVPNAMACSKIETGYNYCWDGSSIFKQRTVYYNGNYVYSAWQLFGSCPPPPPPPAPSPAPTPAPSPAPTPAPSPAPKVDPFGPINSGGGGGGLAGDGGFVGDGSDGWWNPWGGSGGWGDGDFVDGGGG